MFLKHFVVVSKLYKTSKMEKKSTPKSAFIGRSR
jgi:hypothetical protein